MTEITFTIDPAGERDHRLFEKDNYTYLEPGGSGRHFSGTFLEAQTPE